MGARYLTELADVLRAAGLGVVELADWRTRARGSGGYENGRPTHVMAHHTGSPPSSSGEGDAWYCAEGDEDAPLSNLCLDRDGRWWILAAGATNTNGKGGPLDGVPVDSMNAYAIGVEANGGYGEAWPIVQTDAYVRGVAALCDAYNIPTGHVRAHFEWAPTRKIDPAGPSPWASGGASWDMSAFRADVASSTGGGPPPEPDRTEDDMIWRVAKRENGAYFLGDGKTALWVKDGDGDIGLDEAALRMAPGAVNVWRCVAAEATDANGGTKMVTGWGGIKHTMSDKNIKNFVGAHRLL